MLQKKMSITWWTRACMTGHRQLTLVDICEFQISNSLPCLLCHSSLSIPLSLFLSFSLSSLSPPLTLSSSFDSTRSKLLWLILFLPKPPKGIPNSLLPRSNQPDPFSSHLPRSFLFPPIRTMGPKRMTTKRLKPSSSTLRVAHKRAQESQTPRPRKRPWILRFQTKIPRLPTTQR